MQSYFIWNGVDCRALGIVVEKPPQILRGEERVNRVAIPGRAGELTTTEGDGIYNSYIQTVSFHAPGAANVGRVLKWLSGEGEVTFSTEPERKQPARITGAMTMTRHSARMDWWHGEVQFYCYPLKSALFEQPVTVTASGSQVNNPGDVPAWPKLTVTCTAGANTTIIIAGQTFMVNLTGTGKTGYIADCEAQIVTSLDGSENLTALSTGEFPFLPEGNSAVTFTNVSKIEFMRRVRWL